MLILFYLCISYNHEFCFLSEYKIYHQQSLRFCIYLLRFHQDILYNDDRLLPYINPLFLFLDPMG